MRSGPFRFVVAAVVATVSVLPSVVLAEGVVTDVHAVIAAVLEAYGGRTTLSALRAYRMDAEVVPAGRDTAVTMTRLFERPDRLRVTIDYPQGKEIRLLDGAHGWRSTGGHPLVPVSGMGRDAMVLQAARANLPWILAERDSVARLVAPADSDTAFPRPTGHRARPQIVEIPLADSLTLRVTVDPTTHRIVESHGSLTSGGVPTSFETQYSEFHRIFLDGARAWVLFAFHEDNFATNVRTAAITIRHVTPNPQLAPDDFAPR